jgi:hypothetical protein
VNPETFQPDPVVKPAVGITQAYPTEPERSDGPSLPVPLLKSDQWKPLVKPPNRSQDVPVHEEHQVTGWS